MTDNLLKLKNLKLDSYSIETVYQLINNFPKMLFLSTKYSPLSQLPKIMERAVQNTAEEPIFNTLERISFKPAEFNKTYQRASTPNNTMFYASPFDDTLQGTAYYQNSRLTLALEVSDLLRQVEFSLDDNVRDITYGQWEVIDELNLITIIDPTKNYELEIMKKVQSNYLNVLNRQPELKQISIDYSSFLAQEFSKIVLKDDNYKYLISSIFTEFALKRGYDGVIYPSVKAEGIGLCLAIHPNCMTKIKCNSVSQLHLIRQIEGASLKITKKCDVEENSKTFKLIDIDKYLEAKNK